MRERLGGAVWGGGVGGVYGKLEAGLCVCVLGEGVKGDIEEEGPNRTGKETDTHGLLPLVGH